MEQTEREILNRILALKSESSNGRSILEKDFSDYWNIYNGKLATNSTYPWRSKIFLREAFKSVDTIHPIFLDMLFQSRDPFRIKGTKADLTEAGARVLERLISIYIEKMGCYNTVDDLVKDILMYGTGFAKIYWKREIIDYEADEVIFEDKVYDIVGLKIKRKVKKIIKVPKTRIIEGPTVERIDWKDIFVGSRCVDVQSSPLIHRTWQTIDQLRSVNDKYKAITGEDFYRNLDSLASRISTSSKAGDQQDQIVSRQASAIGLADQEQLLELNAQGELEILEYWSADSMKVITVAGGQEIIRSAQNPFQHKKKPILCINYIRRPGTIYGIGCCELSMDGQSLLNTSVNQTVDNNTLTNNVMLIADRESNIDFDQIKARPGGVIFVDREPNERLMDKIQQLKFAKVEANDVISLAIREIQEVTGAGRLMQGTYESGAVRNTSQTRLLMGQSGKRFTGKVITFEEMFLKPFVRILYSLIQQYVDEDTIVNMIGDQEDLTYVKVDKLSIARDVDFYPVGSRQLIEMEQTIHQMNNFLAVTAGIPYAPALVNFRYILQKIWDCISPDHDGHRVILSDKEAKRAFQEMQSLQQMGGATKIMEGGDGKQAGLGGTNASQPNMAGGVQ